MFLANEEIFQRSSELSHSHIVGRSVSTLGGKLPSLHRSRPGCQNNKGGEGCGLCWNPTWYTQSIEQRREGFLWLMRVCVKRSGVLERHRKIGRLGWSSQCTS